MCGAEDERKSGGVTGGPLRSPPSTAVLVPAVGMKEVWGGACFMCHTHPPDPPLGQACPLSPYLPSSSTPPPPGLHPSIPLYHPPPPFSSRLLYPTTPAVPHPLHPLTPWERPGATWA